MGQKYGISRFTITLYGKVLVSIPGTKFYTEEYEFLNFEETKDGYRNKLTWISNAGNLCEFLCMPKGIRIKFDTLWSWYQN